VDHYLERLSDKHRTQLTRLNRPGLEMLRQVVDGGKAIAFLGAGASAPLYPLWKNVIDDLVDAAASRLDLAAVATCKDLAAVNPDAVVEKIRRELGAGAYRDTLRQVFRARRDPETGRTYTLVHELVARCDLAGVVTTNYDPGIVNARMAVRPAASGTGFASWTDEDALDRWRTGDVFGDDELPVLYAHGHHNQPDSIVLATSEYRRAYGGKLARVLARLVDAHHLIWVGFSFADQRIGAILREIAEGSGARIEPGTAPRHVAIMPWNPGPPRSGERDPGTVTEVMEIQFGCRVVLYPAVRDDHSALAALLADFTHARFGSPAPPPVPVPPHPVPAPGGAAGPVVRWMHGGTRVAHFTGRAEELARLDRWAGDREVRLIGVTAWGGAGKTALVTEWQQCRAGDHRRPIRGVFAWSFYESRAAEEWASALLEWVAEEFGCRSQSPLVGARLLEVLRAVPLLLVLDGMEVAQEGPAGAAFGRLLDGVLRTTLITLCQLDHAGLVVLTSRFPFADLEQFDGAAVRMLDLPPFTPAEGAMLLDRAGGNWLPERERRDLVRAVDGHALAVGVLAATLTRQPPTGDMAVLRVNLAAARRTDERVTRVLAFYADRLAEADRQLVGLVSLFQRPVTAATILALGGKERLGRPLAGWSVENVEAAARQRLSGLLTWHRNGTLSAHPLVRDAFRPLALSGDAALLALSTALADLPTGRVRSAGEALRVVEMIELLLDADQWEAANDLYRGRTDDGEVWMDLPAARLGQRCASAFVATPERQLACRRRLSDDRLGFFLNEVGLSGATTGDVATAEPFLRAADDHERGLGMRTNRLAALLNLAEYYTCLGDSRQAADAAAKALEIAQDLGDRGPVLNASSYSANALALGGDVAGADRRFVDADQIQFADDGEHLFSGRGIQWAEFLLRSGRTAAARRLTDRNRSICLESGWNDDVARCDRLLGCCELASGHFEAAGLRLEHAVEAFREGDHVVDLVATLPELAEQVRGVRRLADAERLCTETIGTAGPRGLVPSHARALTVRGHIRADRGRAGDDRNHLERARDDADLAIRLATRVRRLPWHEYQACRLQAHLDHLDGRDAGWARRAAELGAVLVPRDLDANPLARVEGMVGPARSPVRLLQRMRRLLIDRATAAAGSGPWRDG
jgi:tetratricopeptide (TPR) repeat protein